jgi:hypothetical protein
MIDNTNAKRNPHPWLAPILTVLTTIIGVAVTLYVTDSGPFAPKPLTAITIDFTDPKPDDIDRFDLVLQAEKRKAAVLHLTLTASLGENTQAIAVSAGPTEDGPIRTLSFTKNCAAPPLSRDLGCDNFELTLNFESAGPDLGYAERNGPAIHVVGYFKVTGEHHDMGIGVLTLLQVDKPTDS